MKKHRILIRRRDRIKQHYWKNYGSNIPSVDIEEDTRGIASLKMGKTKEGVPLAPPPKEDLYIKHGYIPGLTNISDKLSEKIKKRYAGIEEGTPGVEGKEVSVAPPWVIQAEGYKQEHDLKLAPHSQRVTKEKIQNIIKQNPQLGAALKDIKIVIRPDTLNYAPIQPDLSLGQENVIEIRSVLPESIDLARLLAAQVAARRQVLDRKKFYEEQDTKDSIKKKIANVATQDFLKIVGIKKGEIIGVAQPKERQDIINFVKSIKGKQPLQAITLPEEPSARFEYLADLARKKFKIPADSKLTRQAWEFIKEYT